MEQLREQLVDQLKQARSRRAAAEQRYALHGGHRLRTQIDEITGEQRGLATALEILDGATQPV